MNFDFNIPMTKSDGCVLINAKDWQDNTSQLLQAYNFKGERSISYLNKVLDVNCNKDVYYENIEKGDLIFITRVASRVSYLKPYKIPHETGDFANVHLLQVIGKFKGEEVSVEAFTPIYDKVFMKKVDVDCNSLFYQDNSATSVGKVLKVGKGGFNPDWTRREMKIKEGQTVLLRDNITTELMIGSEAYIATEDNMVVGYFEGDIIDFEHLKVLDDLIVMEEFEDEHVEGSSLFKPVQQDDISELYKNNEFKVLKVGKGVKKVTEGMKVLVERDKTNYMTFMNKKYLILNKETDLMATFN